MTLLAILLGSSASFAQDSCSAVAGSQAPYGYDAYGIYPLGLFSPAVCVGFDCALYLGAGEIYVWQDYDGVGATDDVTVFGVDNGVSFCVYIDTLTTPFGVGTLVLTGSVDADIINVLVGDLQTEIHGLDGRDEIWGSEGPDYIDGGEKGDEVHGRGGDDTIYGGTGPDDLTGDGGDDYLVGGDGNDVLRGKEGADELYGSSGSDVLCAGPTDGVSPDYMRGAGDNNGLEFPNAVDTLWAGSSVSPPPTGDTQSGDVCGHTAHGTTWAGACSYTLTSRPLDCDL